MIPELFRNVPFFALVVALFVGIAGSSLRRPVQGLGMLYLSLPALSQSWRLFGWSRPFPSLETWAVALLAGCALVHQGMVGRKPPTDAERSLPRTPAVRPRNNMVKAALAVFLVAGAVSALASEAPGLGLQIMIAGGLAPVVVWLVARRSVVRPDDVRWLLFGLFGLVAQTGIYALVNFNEHALGASGSLEAFGGVTDMTAGIRMFTVPSAGVAVLLPAIPLAAWYALHGRGPHGRGVVAGLTVLLVLVSVTLSFSRGSWLAAAVAVLLSLPIVFRRIRPGWVLVAVGVAVLLTATGVFDVVEELVRFRVEGANAARNISGRALNYRLALQSAPRYALVGLGPGRYPAIYAAYPEAAASFGVPLWFAHSLFLTLIPEIGLLGTLAFGVPFVRTLWRGLRKVRLDNRLGALGYAIAAGVVSYLVVALTAGTHLVTYLNAAAPENTWLTAPALIVLFGLIGAAEGMEEARWRRV